MNRLAACQIPEDVLTQLSTPALLQTILDYPFLPDILAFDTYNAAFEMMRLKFNGMEALLSREDCFDTVYTAYQSQNMNLDERENAESTNGVSDLTKITFIETFLAQSDLATVLSESEKAQLSALVDEKYNEKLQYPDIYGITLYTPYIVDGFQSDSNSESSPFVMKPTPDLCSIKWIYPACGGKVEAWIVHESLTSKEYNAWMETVKIHKSAVVLGPPTLTYNCHSYAFWDASATNEYWIDSAINFLACYNASSTPTANARAYYMSNAHSGIVTSVGGKAVVKSKWGSGPLVSSNYDDNPYYVQPSDVKYYTPK